MFYRSICSCTNRYRASPHSSSHFSAPRSTPISFNPKRKSQGNLHSRYRDCVRRDNPRETWSKEHSQPLNGRGGSNPAFLQNRLGHHKGNRWRVLHVLEQESKERTVGNAEFAPTSCRRGRRRPPCPS